jgi:hypothetical protein
MAQTHSTVQARDNPLNQDGLCILSLGMFLVFVSFDMLTLELDGGGVRGLSTLLILRALMAKVNAERKKNGKPSIKPCELLI